MKAVAYHGVGDIRLDNIKEPFSQHDFDAIMRLTASAICGSDLHFVRGTVPGMQEATVLGHKGVGVVEEVAKGAHNAKRQPMQRRASQWVGAQQAAPQLARA
jgi:threonine dehydrogenase-like Zn-dependent dehydrogenase